MSLYNVIKAGGTSVAAPPQMKTIINETFKIHDQATSQDKDAVTILITSGGGERKDRTITNKNTNLTEKMAEGNEVEKYRNEIWERELENVSSLESGRDVIMPYFSILDSALKIDGHDERYSAVCLSVGERVKAAEFSAIMNKLRLGSTIHLDYDKTGVITTDGLKHATKTDKTYESIGEALIKDEYKGKILVLGGFMGIDEDTGKITTLERGGSDTHAVWIGIGTGAERVYIYSDTLLRRADPKIVPYAEVIERVTYSEMEEFIGFGSKILAERANKAAEEASLELILRDTTNVDRGETIISSRENGGYGNLKGVAAHYAITLDFSNLGLKPGIYNDVTTILKRYSIAFTGEGGLTRQSNMVLVDNADSRVNENIGHVGREIANLGMMPVLKYGVPRIGIIGEGLKWYFPEVMIKVGKILKKYNLQEGVGIVHPPGGVALSVQTPYTVIKPILKDLHDSLFLKNKTKRFFQKPL